MLRNTFLPALALALAALAPPRGQVVQDPTGAAADSQDPAAQDVDARQRPPLEQYREQRSAELSELMEGAWRLTSFLHSSSQGGDTGVNGFAMFHGGYGSIIVHVADYPEDALEPETLFQATGFHYRFDHRLRLQTGTILGHGDFNGELDIEPTNFPREFEVEVFGDILILTRPDGSRLQFQRMRNAAFPEKTLLLIQEARGRGSLPAVREDF